MIKVVKHLIQKLNGVSKVVVARQVRHKNYVDTIQDLNKIQHLDMRVIRSNEEYIYSNST